MGAVVLLLALQAHGPADQARARKLTDEGLTHYNVAEYDQAIESFKAAYVISKAPGLLFNIAQAYRLKGDCAQALHFYKNYLRVEPSAKQRAKAQARVEEMSRCTRERAAAPAAPPPV